MFYKKNLIFIGLLLVVIFAGAIGLVGVRMEATVNRIHYSMVEELGHYRTELIRQDFQKTEELSDRIEEFLENKGYQREQLKELIHLLLKLDHKISRIWYCTGVYRVVCADSSLEETRTDSLVTIEESGLYSDQGVFYWTLCGRCEGIVYGIDISLAQLHAYFSDLIPARQNYACILNDSAVIIAHPEEKWLGMRLADTLERKRIAQASTGDRSIHIAGFSQFLLLPVDKLYYPIAVGNEKWVVVINVVQLDNQEIMASFHRYSWWIVTFTVLIFITLLIYSQYRWQKEYDLRQKAEREAMRLNLQQLKEQLNPHFLFNALNSLSVLIGTDQETARKFVLELSKVYRYVLEKRKESLVVINEEIEFTRHYYFLQKIRFGAQLELQIDESVEEVSGKIPAMSLQLIIENAIKYNEITRQYPLIIHIYADAEALVIENSYHPRGDVSMDSFGLGVESIREIYRFYSVLQFTYEVREDKFICRLPYI